MKIIEINGNVEFPVQSILMLQYAKSPTYLYSFEMDPGQRTYGSCICMYNLSFSSLLDTSSEIHF